MKNKMVNENCFTCKYDFDEDPEVCDECDGQSNWVRQTNEGAQGCQKEER
ncbi:MAG: hypothetical protein ABIB71_08200 [Candidatus Woesearchaeota archaeon]